MKKTLTTLLAFLALATAPVGAITLKRVSVHDPSVVWEPNSKYYYLFGTQRGCARSLDMMGWTSVNYTFRYYKEDGTTGGVKYSNNSDFSPVFKYNQTKTVTINGSEKTFGNFDAYAWSAATVSGYVIDGNMWAPDVVYNKKMGKWCMYYSINGDNWGSSIVLLTADAITGPYTYQGPVVFSGFHVTGNADRSYKKTDLDLVLGTLSSLPARYNVGSGWGRRWPHAIDPCVFYDEEGTLRLIYGSWSGGIWTLKLNEETGLRDYETTYSIAGSGDGVTSDPYFGKKIAGGYYVSGEGAYIEHIGDYYYLFVSYGFMLSAQDGTSDQKKQGGYQMRVFRSANPDGPYTDSNGTSAIYTSYQMNYGPTAATNRGVNIFGAYSKWGNMSRGEREQGHNSIIAAEDGRTYLVYHTRFQDDGSAQGHAVRVHQMFQNKDGWLVAAPFEYTGETVKSADIATTQQVATDNIPGTYKMLVHRYKLDYVWGNQETVEPIDVTLSADGKITGDRTGTWTVEEGTSYMTLTVNGVAYNGVMVNQVMESNTTAWPSTTFNASRTNKTVAFTGLARSGVTIWAYRSGDDPSGIGAPLMNNEGMNNKWYDLQGRRIDTPTQKGVYIQNGKKYILK